MLCNWSPSSMILGCFPNFDMVHLLVDLRAQFLKAVMYMNIERIGDAVESKAIFYFVTLFNFNARSNYVSYCNVLVPLKFLGQSNLFTFNFGSYCHQNHGMMTNKKYLLVIP